MGKKKVTKAVIIILAVLLTLSLIALAGTLIYNRMAEATETTVTVPNNLITPEEDKRESETEETESNAGSQAEGKDENAESHGSNSAEETENSSATNPTGKASAMSSGTDNKKTATAIELYNKQPQDNTAFEVGNMFPGDSETKYYGVQVSYHDKVTVHFVVDIRRGYEKIAEVMKVKVKLLNTDEVMYEGLMKEMPESITYKLTSFDSTTEELYYEITAYLDTAVGNEYQNKDMVADFKWWVEETGNLDKLPQTGDRSRIIMWSVIAITSALIMFVLLQFRREREGTQNG